MSDKLFYVFDDYNNEHDTVESEEEALKWCEEALDYYRNTDDDGIPEEICFGSIGYCKIISKSEFNETDRRENYKCILEDKVEAHCSSCDMAECVGTDEWEHFNDIVGTLELKKTETKRKPDTNGVLPLTSEELRELEKLVDDYCNNVRLDKYGGVEYNDHLGIWQTIYEIKAIIWLAERFELGGE